MPSKNARGAAASRPNKSAQNATRASARTGAADTTIGRQALKEKAANDQPKAGRGRGKKRAAEDLEVEDAPEEEEEEEEEEDGGESVSKSKIGRGRPRAKAAKLAEEPTASELETKPAAQPAKRGRKPKAQVTPPVESEIPETQPVEMLEDTLPMEVSMEDEQFEELPSYNRHGISSIQRASSVQRLSSHVAPFSASRRPIAASDSEMNDPSLRRRIGDLTRKYENLEVKYRDLRELGVKEAERNYDRLKKQGEERAKTANDLIATLKAQLAAQTELAKEGQRLKQQLEASETQVLRLQDKVAETTAFLTEAKSEIKTLSTKLAASRTEAANVKIPGSAIKGNTGEKRLLANAEAANQVSQMKETLYGDLTGLIICNIKKEKNDEEVYDCIQTGRNGTLHFKLAVGVDGTSDNFDETQFMYVPQLDPSRDRDLIEMLPDYLVEEITFPRPHAAKFYSRVMKSLTERQD